MKKKFFALVAVIVAFVMSFALIACGGPADSADNNNTTRKKSASERAVGAVSEMFNKSGVSGTLNANVTVSGVDAVKIAGSFEKSGDRIKLTGGGMVSVLDLSTGYVYMLENGVAVDYDTALPAGLYNYVVDTFDKYTAGAEISEDMWKQVDEIVTYDAKTRTVTYRTDVAEIINDLTYNLYEAYKGDKTVTWLLDEYLLDMTGEMIRYAPGNPGLSIMEVISSIALVFPEQKVGDILDSLKTQYGLDVEGMLAEQGIDVVELLKGYGIETTAAALKARTIEDIVVGVYKAITPTVEPDEPQSPQAEQLAEESGEDGDIDSEIGGGMEQMLPIILDGAVNGKKEAGDLSAAEVVDEMLVQLKQLTNNAHVKALINEMLAADYPELVAAIAAGVQVKELSLTMSVTLDENDKLDSMSIACVFEHDYNGKVEDGFTVLANNKYAVDVKLDVTAYTDSPEAITFTYGDASKLHNFYVNDAIITGDKVTEDVKIFVELFGMQNAAGVTVTAGSLAYVSDDYGGYQLALVQDDNIIYDKATSTVTVKAAYINAFLANAQQGETLELCLGVGESALTLYEFNIILLPDDEEDFQSALEIIIDGIMGDFAH